ncbi:MAG: histidine phosphatase family protein [Candidatus Pacebacteria bacterium]|nr:histidine phosphatase family protein [Candidatus Paceibacterota bacterium]
MKEKFALGVGDADTPLADLEGRQAFETGRALSACETTPHVIFVSPYLRACLTLEHMMRGWPALKSVKVYQEERIREQEHGLALLYNDWRVFHALHPDQAALYELEGPYWYRYPQGENVPDVRERNRSWTTTLIRDFAQKDVLAVTHHLNILGIRANFERLGDKEFIRLDEEEKPINCGATLYTGYPNEGSNGRLKLTYYNKRYYELVA